jgi:hypothetical protein
MNSTVLSSCVLLLGLIAIILVPQSALAQSEMMMMGPQAGVEEHRLASLEELSKTADLIFVGDCTEVKSAWNPTRTMIFTTVTHQVDGNFVFKGSPAGVHTFIRPGGQVDNIKTVVSDQPSYGPGDRSLLFLYQPSRVKLYGTVGGAMGKIPIARDPKSEQEVVRLWTMRDKPGKYYSAAPSGGVQVMVPLTELKQLIADWVGQNEVR